MSYKKILIEFDNSRAKYGAKGLAEAVKLFERAGLTPTDATVDEKTKRSAGMSYRKVQFHFADGQMVEMWVKFDKSNPEAGGDIFKVLVGGSGVAASIKAKEFPIKNQDDHAAAIAEIVSYLKGNEDAFQKKLAKVKVKLPTDKATVSRVKQEDALTQRVADLKEAIVAADERIAELEKVKLGVGIEVDDGEILT